MGFRLPRHTPHIVYSLAIVSLGIHTLWHKKTAEAQRAQIAARISILETLAADLRSGKNISDTEVERLKRLSRPRQEDPAVSQDETKEEISWWEVILGNKDASGLVDSKYDERDLEKGIQWPFLILPCVIRRLDVSIFSTGRDPEVCVIPTPTHLP
jgi:hypothetical protein